MTARSSNAGWRCSSRALSAPAVAGGAEHGDARSHGPSPPAARPARRRSCGAWRDLLVGQRAVGGPEVQAQRQRDVARADPLGVAVDVEHLGAGQQRAAGAPGHGQHLRGRPRSATITARSSRTSGKLVTSSIEGSAPGSATASRSSSNAATGSVEVPLRRHQRMDLPQPAGGRAVEQDPRRATRVQERLGLVAALHAPRDPHGVEQPGEHALGGEEVGAAGESASRQVAGLTGPVSSAAEW